MSLSNMREHGVRSVEATCEHCKHEAIINVDSLPDDLYVPDAEAPMLSLRLEEPARTGPTTGPMAGAAILPLVIRVLDLQLRLRPDR
jgi:hypothetical protein